MSRPASIFASRDESHASISTYQAFLLILAVTIVSYGYNLTNFTLNIDGEIADNILHTISLGRWGHAFLHAYLLPEPYLPYFTDLVGLIALALAALLAAKTIGFTGVMTVVFGALMVSFPQLAYQLQFTNQADTYPIGLLLAVLSAYFYIRFAFGTPQRWRTRYPTLLLSIVSATLALSIYQTLIVVSPLVVLGFLLVRSQSEGARPGRDMMLLVGYAAALVVSLVVYFLTAKAAQGLAGSGSQASYLLAHASEFETLSDSLLLSLTFFGELLQGTSFYGLGAFPIAVVAVALIIGLRIGARWQDPVWATALLSMMFLVPLTMILATQGSLPPRALSFMPVLFATMIAVAVKPFKIQWVVAGALFVVLSNIAMITNLFYSDHLVRQADIQMGKQIQSIIDNQFPGYAGSETTRVFWGAYGGNESRRLPESDIFGTSFFNYGGGNNHRIFLFLQHAVPIAQYQRATSADVERVRGGIADMPTWPDPRAVAVVDGIVVIKLQDDPEWSMKF
ncbi:glucosyltransferase domain-containing protein [Thioalkalivibrio paradoxus]|nr:glucosyltransferase domain-containing protein [Thioalkalivibrio paradoxus]